MTEALIDTAADFSLRAHRQEQSSIAGEVERYLRTGETDSLYSAWPGNFLERANRAHAGLRGALVSAVIRLSEGGRHQLPPNVDTVALTRTKVEPMVRGFFPLCERAAVLAMLERSVVFLTSANIERTLMDCSFDSTAWTLANLYLASIGAEVLGEDAPRLVGLSEETTCYISLEYFAEEDPFEDFIVHEAAHIFHNCKRAGLGLRTTRTKEWLLEIDYRKRETFAYSCEAYARVIERANGCAERQALVDLYSRALRVSDERVDAAEISDIVREAALAGNGWKVILARCAPSPRGARGLQGF